MSPSKRSKKRILLHDPSDPLEANLRVFLEREGFTVDYEVDPEKAVKLASEGWYDLMILRMTKRKVSDPEKQILAALERFPKHLQKILYRGMGDYSEMAPPPWLVNRFNELNTRQVNNREDFEDDNIAGHAHHLIEFGINQVLEISPAEQSSPSLPAVIEYLEGALDRDLFRYRLDELENLLCRYFTDQDVLELEKLLWNRDERLGILISQYSTKSFYEDHCLLVIQKESPFETTREFKQVPGVLSLRGKPERSPHYSLVTYNLESGPVHHNLVNLHELHNRGRDELLQLAIGDLLSSGLPKWKTRINNLSHSEDICLHYRTRLKLGSPSEIAEKFKTLCDKIQNRPSLTGAEISLDSENITFTIPTILEPYYFPNPIPLLTRFLGITLTAQLTNCPGTLHLDNLLVELPECKTWLSDCSGQGFAPTHWAAVCLEAEMRFGSNTNVNLPEIFLLEQALTSTEMSVKLDGIPDGVLTSARAIAAIRTNESSRYNGLNAKQTQIYLIGLVYLALANLLNPNAGVQISQRQARLVFGSMAGLVGLLKMIAELEWFPKAPIDVESDQDPTIKYNKMSGKIATSSVEIPIKGTGRQFLIYCMEQPQGTLLKYKDIYNGMLAQKKSETLHEPKINTFEEKYGQSKDDGTINLNNYVQSYKSHTEKILAKLFPNLTFFERFNNEGYYFHNPPKPK
ncbi:MAG TPA: hypothetical protein VGK00_11085 [Anaerolineales bacterium]|jgi:hypothetical protein